MTFADRIHITSKLRRLAWTILTRWPLLIMGLAIGLTIGVWRAQNVEEIFRATSRLAITVQATTPDKPHLIEEHQTYWQNQIALATSYTVKEATLTRLAKSWTETPPRSLGLSATQQAGTSMLLFAVESSDWRYASAYATAWADAYIAYKEGLRSQAISKAAGQISAEITRVEGLHTQAQDSLLAFQRSNNLSAAQAAKGFLDQATARAAALSSERKLLEEMTKDELTIVATANQKSTNSLDLLQSEHLSTLQMELRQKEAEVRLWAGKMKAANPYLISLRQQVSTIADQIAWQIQLLDQRRHMRVAALKREEAGYGPLLAELRTAAITAAQTLAQHDILLSQSRTLAAELAALKQRREFVEQTSVTEEKLQILERGVVERGDSQLDRMATAMGGYALPKPVGPTKASMVVKSATIGTFVGLLLIVWLHANDKRVSSAEEAEEKLAEPVIAELPKARMNPAKLQPTESHYMESIRALRNTVMLTNRRKNGNVLLITSTGPGEGKTSVVAHLGRSIADAGRSVLLIDADLRRGKLNAYFPGGCSSDHGLGHWLTDRDWSGDFLPVYRGLFEVSGVRVLACGQNLEHPGEALLGPKLQRLIGDAREHFDYILIDTPPIGAVDDAAALMPLADGTLYVIRSGQTQIDLASTTIAALKSREVKLDGLIMVGADADERNSYRNHYYASYQGKPSVAKSTALPRIRLNFGRGK